MAEKSSPFCPFNTCVRKKERKKHEDEDFTGYMEASRDDIEWKRVAPYTIKTVAEMESNIDAFSITEHVKSTEDDEPTDMLVTNGIEKADNVKELSTLKECTSHVVDGAEVTISPTCSTQSGEKRSEDSKPNQTGSEQILSATVATNPRNKANKTFEGAVFSNTTHGPDIATDIKLCEDYDEMEKPLPTGVIPFSHELSPLNYDMLAVKRRIASHDALTEISSLTSREGEEIPITPEELADGEAYSNCNGHGQQSAVYIKSANQTSTTYPSTSKEYSGHLQHIEGEHLYVNILDLTNDIDPSNNQDIWENSNWLYSLPRPCLTGTDVYTVNSQCSSTNTDVLSNSRLVSHIKSRTVLSPQRQKMTGDILSSHSSGINNIHWAPRKRALPPSNISKRIFDSRIDLFSSTYDDHRLCNWVRQHNTNGECLLFDKDLETML